MSNRSRSGRPAGETGVVFDSVRVRVGGSEMHARISREAPGRESPPVVMVHGLGLSGRYMEPAARAIRHCHRVYLPDLPGFGDSEKPRRALTLAELADSLAGWAAAARVEGPVLVANSFGCQIALEAAVRHPGLASALVLQGPTTPPGDRTWWRQFRRWRQNGPFNRPGMSEVSFEDYRKAGYLRILRTFRESLHDRPEEKLALVRVPVLVVRGEFDPICRPEWAAQVATGLPRGHLATLPHVAHTLVWDAPAELAALSMQFIDRAVVPRTGAAGFRGAGHAHPGSA